LLDAARAKNKIGAPWPGRREVEVEGGLYVTRGNNGQAIVNCDENYRKILSLLEIQKSRLPFFLYA